VAIRADFIGEIPGEGKRSHYGQNEKQHGNKNPCSHHFLETFPWAPVAVESGTKTGLPVVRAVHKHPSPALLKK
jgi:hypothetical protein